MLYQKRGKPLELNVDLLFNYGAITVCNVPLAKVFVVLIRKISGKTFSMDSGYYTLIALLPTVSAVLLYLFCTTYPDRFRWSEKVKEKGLKGMLKDLAPALVLLFMTCFMLLIFEPILMYATNINDFWFDFSLFIGPLLNVFARVFLLGLVLIVAVYQLDLLISKRLLIYRVVTLIGFALFFLTYLQGNWLAGNLPILEGGEIKWEDYGKIENLILLVAAIILAVAAVKLIQKYGLNRAISCATAGSLAVFIMLSASLVPTVLTNHALDRKDTFSPTVKNYNTISSNKNFLIFLVDCVNPQVYQRVMESDADFQGTMEDFTFYPDTTCMYPYTTDSILNILTGAIYRNETVARAYSTNAFNQSPLFEKLTQNGYDINLYSNSIFWDGERNYNIGNSASIHDDSIDVTAFMKQELKYVLFKYLPYKWKPLSKIETLDFTTCRVSNLEYAPYSDSNQVNYKSITENAALEKQEQNYFHFVHCLGSHRGYHLDKNLNYLDHATEEQVVAGCLTMIKSYLQRLKANDAYDNSVIIIMSDHGNNKDEHDTVRPIRELERFNALLFIKGVNEKHEMLESDRSVSYAELNNAFLELLDGKQSTELFTDLEPGRRRTVLWKRVAENDKQKVEYEIIGKAWEVDKYTPTGNVYNLEE